MRKIPNIFCLFTLLTMFILRIIKCQFQEFGSEELTDTILEIYKYNIDYFKIDTAQMRYGLPSQDCKNRKKIEENYQNELSDIDLNPCDNFILIITDFNSYSYERNHVYIYTGLDGTDVTGTKAIIEFLTKYFLEDNIEDKWFRNLLKEIVLVITPNTNAFGFSNKISKEISKDKQLIDINDDFIWKNSDDNDQNLNNISSYAPCIQTNSVRTMISLFREFNFIMTMNIGNISSKNTFSAIKTNPIDNYYIVSIAEQFYRSTKEIDTNPDLDISEVDKRINWTNSNNLIKAFTYMSKFF